MVQITDEDVARYRRDGAICLRGVFDADQKREIVQKLTEAMVSIEGENMRGDMVRRRGSAQR